MTSDRCNEYTLTLPPRRPDVRTYDFGEETVLHDPTLGSMNLLNKTASAVWHRCDGTVTISAIADELVREYDVDPDMAQDHVEQLVSLLARSGLLMENS